MSKAYLTEAAQDEQEISAFCELVKREGVTSYLEVGSKFGGSLWRVANAMPEGSLVVSVDMPGGTKAWKESEQSLIACHEELRRRGYRTHAIWGDSTKRDTIAAAQEFAPFGMALLDGDHRTAGVTADWLNYGPMAGIVAFHDISWRRADTWVGTRIDVPEFWNEIKGGYRHEEIVHCPTGKNNGLGILWRS
jgi:predicted O-methyltransferase YrrM